jgi:peptidoglycan-N-acetylglucosamine deacetylase
VSDTQVVWAIFFAVILLDLVIGVIFVSRQRFHRGHGKLRAKVRALVTRVVEAGAPTRAGAADPSPLSRREKRFARRHHRIVLEESARAVDTVRLAQGQKEALAAFLAGDRTDLQLVRGLHSPDRLVRARSAMLMPLAATQPARVALINALEREKSHSVKLFMAAALTEIGESFAIPSMIDSLAGEPLRYQQSLWGLLSEFREDFAALLPVLTVRPEKEIQLLTINFAGRYRSTELRDYVTSRVDDPDRDISHEAFRILCAAYPDTIDCGRFLVHDDVLIRNLTAETLGRFPTTASLVLLFDHMDDSLMRRSLTLAVTAILRARPQHFRAVMLRCLAEQRPRAHAALVEVLSGYVDYLMEKLDSPDAVTVARVLIEIVRHGKAQEIINFLNRNADAKIERMSLAILRRLAADSPPLARQLSLYLSPRLLPRLGLAPVAAPAPAPPRREHPRLLLLYLFLFVGAAGIPVACALLSWLAPTFGPPAAAGGTFLDRFLGDFNVIFTVYATAINAIYILLLVFSAAGVRRQAAQGDVLRLSLLFKEHVLPSISILTPAYNEEASIVESVTSLLNLRYPDYEVIVINDGSKDGTLKRLVDHFNLERTDLFVHRYLNTMEIRGIYANKRYPELLVVDKENGGKADSLNAGINVARKEYFAGIDADSMLERDALLNLAGLFLFSDDEVVAAGGNIFPVNGCAVRRGDLLSTRIPKKPIARFQTIEYLRAFMAGRVGWAAVKALLIISGAFGVFHRRRVIDAHGYLTRSEHYMKDTVGEDMELVVRLTRGLRESRTPFSVLYAHNANCWTEIPERLAVLNRQRDRWQRGLLDNVTFHWKMMFNPVYGRMGLIGFPYFLIFEILGPWFEAEGFLVLIASLVLGAIGVPMFLLLFTATVLLGLFVSTEAMIIAEHRREYFPFGDKLLLLFYAFIESFGFRQMMNLTRVRGLLRMLRRVGGWGAMERRGIATAARPST